MSNIRYFLGLFFTWPNLYNFIFDTEKKKVVVQDTSTYVFFHNNCKEIYDSEVKCLVSFKKIRSKIL